MRFVKQLTSLGIDQPIDAEADVKFKDFLPMENHEKYLYYEVGQQMYPFMICFPFIFGREVLPPRPALRLFPGLFSTPQSPFLKTSWTFSGH